MIVHTFLATTLDLVSRSHAAHPFFFVLLIPLCAILFSKSPATVVVLLYNVV